MQMQLQPPFDAYICFSRKDIVDEYDAILEDSPIMQIVGSLNRAGYHIFFDEKGSLLGDDYKERILPILEASNIFVFLSTKNANESEVIRREVAIADELGKTIIPVRVDDTPYHRSLWARIVDLNYCKFFANPDLGIKDLETAIKKHKEKIRYAELLKQEEERQNELEEQKRREKQGRLQDLQAQIKEQHDIVRKIESEILNLKKQVLTYQYELQSADLDLQNRSREELRLRSLIANLEKSTNH